MYVWIWERNKLEWSIERKMDNGKVGVKGD